MPSTPNTKKTVPIFNTIALEQEFHSTLSFVAALCEVSFAFIALLNKNGATIKTKIGFEDESIPPSLVALHETVIKQNKIKIVPSFNTEGFNPSENISFFAGLPMSCTDNQVIGTLCIMDAKPKALSPLELHALHHAVQQIQSLLKVHLENQKLRKRIKKQEKKYQLFIVNPKEIAFGLDLDGIISDASSNWFDHLGYEIHDVVGKSTTSFLHPEDVENCIQSLNEVIRTGKNQGEFTYRILHKKGHYIWHATRFKLAQKEGHPIFIGNARDITAYMEIQQKLVQQKEFYEKILDRLPTDVAVFDHHHRYTYLNPAAIKNEELRKFIIGKTDFEYAIHTGRNDAFAKGRNAKFLQALESRNTLEWEDTIEGLDGKKKYHTRKFTPVFGEDDTLEMMVGFGVDITESKEIQEEILKNRQLTKSIIQNVAVGILVQEPQSEIVAYNKAACEMLGLTEDQLLGKNSYDADWKLIHLDGTTFKPEEFPVPLAIQKLKPINNSVMGVQSAKNQDLVWLLVDAIPVFGDSHELLYVICSFNDITAQKNAEDALKISNERFTYSSKATSDAIWDWNMITDKIVVGASYSILFGHQFENNIITGQECEDFIHPDDKVAYLKSMDEFINGTDDKWSMEYLYLKSDGTYACVNDKAIIIRDEAGKATRMIGAMQDATLEKKLKDELQQSEAQFKGAFENSAVGMALINTEGFYIEVNDRLCEMIGYSNQEMKFLKLQEITHTEDLAIDLEYKEQLDSGKITNFSSEKRFIHKNNSIVWAHMSVSLSINNTNEIKYYIVQIIDITERKKIEAENKLLTDENNRNKTIQLNEAQNLYRLLADNTIDLVCLHNLDSSFLYVSPSIEKLLGYTPDELLGKFPQEYVHPEDIVMLQNSVHGFINEAADIAVQIRFRNNSGDYLWLETKAILVKENGIPIRFQSSTRDITQRKEAEKIVENTLIRERELNELRINLVSTISHEFRTPMTTIRTSAELMAMYIENQELVNGDRLLKRVAIITEEIDRIVELMNAVLTISKDDSGKTTFKPILFDLKEYCLELIDNNFINSANIPTITTNFTGDFYTILADKNLIKNAVLNILNNAFKYSKNSKNVLLFLTSTQNTVVLEIIDFGIGIPEQDQVKLFNTFYRASNTDGFQGTGLGLYIAKTFVEKNSGTITLESELGKGTKVTLKFPLPKQAKR
ncbi:PAS domain S-box protein [Flavobacterium restrictum]|uniref:histidine kinase n=1 Tax=Flavobacterium restrictum TaxID=2594428 RepID=A0A553E8Y6_9FLAO|nr:PAS domain S-box protein [Flavobacterium restrictum]TRX41539.1 PAS domain S-box protein [Flavobacterium restrictum]